VAGEAGGFQRRAMFMPAGLQAFAGWLFCNLPEEEDRREKRAVLFAVMDFEIFLVVY
jgi:hypothetical protein